MPQKIKLLLPKGSLNNPERGNTSELLKQAGYDIVGYEPGRESDRALCIRNDDEIELMLARPQSMPNELLLGFADLAIVGSDWVIEETNGDGLAQIADLEYGRTRLVFAVPMSCPAANLEEFVESAAATGITCFTEYVNTAARALAGTRAYAKAFGAREPIRQMRGVRVGSNERVKVIMSDGVTEGYIKKGANLVLDNTQTGSSLALYGLKELQQIGASSACLYASSQAAADPWLRAKAEEIARQLLGVTTARQKYYVVFNVQNDRLDAMRTFIESQKLYSDEPTIIAGANYSQISVLVPRGIWPSILRKFIAHGASSIMRYEPLQIMDGATMRQNTTTN